MNRLALRTVIKMLDAISSALEEFRYETQPGDRDDISLAMKRIGDAKYIIQELLEREYADKR